MDKSMVLPEAIPDEWLKKFHRSRRLALAKKCYFEAQLNRYKRWDKVLKVILALTSTSVVGLAIWHLLFPQNVVTYISTTAAAITAVIGVLQPILGFSEKIDESTELLGNYKRGVRQFRELEFLVQKDKLLTVEEFKKIYATNMRGIDDSGPNEAQLTRYYDKVVNEILPSDSWKIAYIGTKETIITKEP